MSDDYDLDLENSSGASAEEDIGKRKIGFLPAIIIKILKWTAIILAGVVFIVTITFFTIKFMNPVSSTPDYYYATEESRNTLPNLQWYDIGTTEIRGRTADTDKRIMIIIKVSVGFNARSKALHQELIDKTPKLRDEIRVFFGEKYEKDITPRNESKVKEELRRRLNIMLSGNDRIQDLIFTDFNLIEF
ncbi:MAG: flagellar basal body-associated FliL family protein [Spirochaetaceae bacterium]|nr:flagellar basal body-associated FliL family protein [Spirochaetaceae bacterium]